ncbi:MAG: tetratricopeptide repeat protein, partial [Desulfuromonadales bacterium]|nr:tetratricopeptide repeat protein [Desulfuromonadales bacterium]
FYWDDYISIVRIPLIKDLSYFTNMESGQAFRGYGGFVSRFFGYFTFALNYRFGGLNVTGYHVVNITIHLLAALLVYRLTSLTFRTPYFSAARNNSTAESRAGFIALLAALLFIVHPLQTQAVTYIVQRLASLASMLYLLSLTSYIRARLIQQEPGKHYLAAGVWFAAALLSALLAMKTKQIAYTLPFAILMYEFLFFTRQLKKKAFALVMAFLLVVLATLAIKLSGGTLGEIISNLDKATRLQTDMSRWDYLATECRVIVTYLRLLLFPVGQRLDYDYPLYDTFLNPAVLLSGALLCSLLGAAVYSQYLSRKEADEKGILHSVIAFGIFWFFITLSIESSVIPIVDVIVEHRMYLPSVGLFMAAAAFVSLYGGTNPRIPGWPRTWIVAGAAAVVILLAGLTVARNQLWRDEVSFWEDNAGKSPQKARVFMNLGRARERRGNLAGAEEAYRTASTLAPDQTDASLNLGLIYTQSGRFTEALAEFKAALAANPDLGEAHNNIGKIYGTLGQFDEALKEFLQAAKLETTMAEPYNNIGYIYALQKRYPDALNAYEKCLKLDPDYDLAYVNRGMALLATNRKDEALADFRRALKINPSNAEAAEQLQLAGQGR